MIRVTIELLPGGRAEGARTIGMIEIANMTTRLDNTADYAVALKKSPPFEGALIKAWKTGRVACDDRRLTRIMAGEDEELLTAIVEGHHRSKRGIYDLVYRALKACGLEGRLPRSVRDAELVGGHQPRPAALRDPLPRGKEPAASNK